MENIDIDKEILENIVIDKILNQVEFGVSNRAIFGTCMRHHLGHVWGKSGANLGHVWGSYLGYIVNNGEQ